MTSYSQAEEKHWRDLEASSENEHFAQLNAQSKTFANWDSPFLPATDQLPDTGIPGLLITPPNEQPFADNLEPSLHLDEQYDSLSVPQRPHNLESKDEQYFTSARPRRRRDAFSTVDGNINAPLFSARVALPPQDIISKVKTGIPSLVGGHAVAALADTGAQENFVSAEFVELHKLRTETSSPRKFRLGNSKYITSDRSVTVPFAFANGTMHEVTQLTCYVLSRCIYPFVLGGKFLTLTETLTKFRSRLSACTFTVPSFLSFNSVGPTCSNRLSVFLAPSDHHRPPRQVFALPDTGAERNIMSLNYARRSHYKVYTKPYHRIWLQFADGTIQQTIGQVYCEWSFEKHGAGREIVFDVLENSCADVVLGEHFLLGENAFDAYRVYFHNNGINDDSDHLAPFDYLPEWQNKLAIMFKALKEKKEQALLQNSASSTCTTKDRVAAARVKEVARREDWDRRYEFGVTATSDERDAEDRRRRYIDQILGLCDPE